MVVDILSAAPALVAMALVDVVVGALGRDEDED